MTLRASTKAYLTFNILSLSWLLFGLRALLNNPLPRHLKEAGHFQFLTNLSLIASIVAIFFDIVSVLVLPQLSKITTYLNLISLILEFIVSTIYWSLKLFFIHLIVNTDEIPPERFIPLWLDLTVHLAPLLILSVDTFLLKKKPVKRSYVVILLVTAGLCVGYWILLEHLIGKARLVYPGSEYPYPFLNVDLDKRVVIFGGVMGLGLGTAFVVETLEDVIEGLYTAKIKTA